MARLGVPHHRACYLCPISVWMPETVHHVLLSCPDDDLVVERRRVREALSELLRSVEELPATGDVAVPPSPNLDDQCALYFILMLATSVGPSDHLPSDSETLPPLTALQLKMRSVALAGWQSRKQQLSNTLLELWHSTSVANDWLHWSSIVQARSRRSVGLRF